MRAKCLRDVCVVTATSSRAWLLANNAAGKSKISGRSFDVVRSEERLGFNKWLRSGLREKVRFQPQ